MSTSVAAAGDTVPVPLRNHLEVRALNAYYGARLAVRDITIGFPANNVTALIGPSGAGKSTLLRCLNRVHEMQDGARVEGEVLLDGENIYDPAAHRVVVRRRIGMVFQQPNAFPTMSVLDNVVAGLALSGRLAGGRKGHLEIAERALRDAALWDEVKDKLDRSGTAISGGQQQRLCIARALAVEPEVLLMDEPTSALDPIATVQIEELVTKLAQRYTIVIVTHNMQQAARISHYTAFMLGDEHRVGALVEIGKTDQIFSRPNDKRTEDYITGRFG
ncbi:MAG TPA: phosphate ABC transporter ATP-binding protein PstB [Candidatus Acidoferrales bacterium]|nr:phosphate ABC transporter ATP-binding protein PstB [Candidatus Acidoferrales bacterium]